MTAEVTITRARVRAGGTNPSGVAPRRARSASLALPILLGLVVHRPSPAWAAPGGLTLGQVLAIALHDNPDVRDARLRVVEANADQHAAGAFPNPSYAVSPGNPYQFIWSLPADIGPQRLVRARAAHLNTEAAGGDLADQVQQTTFDVRQAFFDVLLADSLRTLALEEEGIVRQLVSADSARARSGDLSAADLRRTSLELTQTEAASSRAVADLHRARLTLQALMGEPAPDTSFTVTGELRFLPLDLPLDSLAAVALRNRADLAAAERRVEQNRALQWGARIQLLPTPVLTVVQQPDMPFEHGLNTAIGVSLEVPMFDWNGAARQRAAAEWERSRLEVGRVRAQIASAISRAIDDHLTARALASHYASGVMGEARLTLESVRYGYRQGSRSFLDLLDAVRSYGQVKADYYSAVHDYWVSAYALSRTAGTELLP